MNLVLIVRKRLDIVMLQRSNQSYVADLLHSLGRARGSAKMMPAKMVEKSRMDVGIFKNDCAIAMDLVQINTLFLKPCPRH